MNFSVPLLALLAARQAKDSASDAGRVALMSMAIKPPMLGLLMAVGMAQQATPPAPPAKGGGGQGGAGGGSPSPGPTRHDFFPSFLGYTPTQAGDVAAAFKLTPHFPGLSDKKDASGLVVVRQEPGAGKDWRTGVHEVTLHLGPETK